MLMGCKGILYIKCLIVRVKFYEGIKTVVSFESLRGKFCIVCSRGM